MPYIEREGGRIVGLNANFQAGYAEEWLADGHEEVVAFLNPPIDLHAYTAQKRWEREVGGIEVAGLTVATDDRSKIMILGARIKADSDPEFTTQWKGPDGAFLTLDAATITLISEAILDHVNDCFAIEADVLAQISTEQITTITEVDAAFGI